MQVSVDIVNLFEGIKHHGYRAIHYWYCELSVEERRYVKNKWFQPSTICTGVQRAFDSHPKIAARIIDVDQHDDDVYDLVIQLGLFGEIVYA